jgi:uncharacterized protein (TIGR00297 family)
MSGEMLRKLVHVAVGGFALTLRWLTPIQAATVALVALAFNLFLLHRLTRGRLLRADERAGGHSWGTALYPGAVLGLILVFHQRLELAAAVWGMLAFGDGMATIIGRWVGGPRLPWNPKKTWSGFIGFFLYATATSAFLLRWTQLAAVDAARSAAPAPDWIGMTFLGTRLEGVPISDVTLLVLGCAVAAAIAALGESLATRIDDNIIVPVAGGLALTAMSLIEPSRLASQAPELLRAWQWALIVNASIAGLAWRLGTVSPSGAWAGLVLGASLWAFGGWQAFVLLLAFFVLGTAATRVGWARKRALGIAQDRGGRRGARHALANVSTAVVCSFLAVATPYGRVFLTGLVAALATAACDTVSTEIGQAFGRRHHDVASWRRVAPGTPGAVSLEGSLAGAAAAALLAAIAWVLSVVPGPGAAVIVLVAALAGAWIESYVGATIESRLGLSNDVVNFLNTLIGAAVAIVLALVFL